MESAVGYQRSHCGHLNTIDRGALGEVCLGPSRRPSPAPAPCTCSEPGARSGGPPSGRGGGGRRRGPGGGGGAGSGGSGYSRAPGGRWRSRRRRQRRAAGRRRGRQRYVGPGEMRRAPAPPPPARPPPPPRSPAPGPGPHCVRREVARPLACGGRRGCNGSRAGAGLWLRGLGAGDPGSRERRPPGAGCGQFGDGGRYRREGDGAHRRFLQKTGRDFERSSRPSPSLQAALPLPP
ncbi:ribosomal large subunit pseudouridine synthase B-like [Desmodus rotundus]|uniref:ribosomal large subunit pseudouridine synthase B-like n=1 Tax=Desmodus rotundus TaxID=9430 RepID=UPI0039E501AC